MNLASLLAIIAAFINAPLIQHKANDRWPEGQPFLDIGYTDDGNCAIFANLSKEFVYTLWVTEDLNEWSIHPLGSIRGTNRREAAWLLHPDALKQSFFSVQWYPYPGSE